MEPSSAMINAGCTAPANALRERSGNCTSGRPVGTSPMTGVLLNHRTLSNVPAVSAASVGGRNFLSRLGHTTPTARVTAAIESALKLTSFIASGQARTAPSGPPVTMAEPRKGRVCMSMMIMPMPDMNPDITEIRREGHKSTDSHYAQKNLYQPRHNDYGECLGEVVRIASDNDRHRHGHGAGRTGYLRPRPPEHRREETHRDSPVYPGQRPKT